MPFTSETARLAGMKGSRNGVKTLDFFKPKMSRVMGVVDNEMVIEVRHIESVKHCECFRVTP